eukprot:1380377-Rhodomonas_salina.1
MNPGQSHVEGIFSRSWGQGEGERAEEEEALQPFHRIRMQHIACRYALVSHSLMSSSAGVCRHSAEIRSNTAAISQ